MDTHISLLISSPWRRDALERVKYADQEKWTSRFQFAPLDLESSEITMNPVKRRRRRGGGGGEGGGGGVGGGGRQFF